MQVATWDATDEPDAAPRVRRSPGLDARLAEAGLAPVGLRGLRADVGHGPHPELTDTRQAVWRSGDGVVAAVPDRLYGVDTLELLTLFADGTVRRTLWASRPGGVPGGWYVDDPRQPARDTRWQRLRSEAVSPDDLVRGGTSARAGIAARRDDDPDLGAVIARHRAWAAEVRDAGPVVPLDPVRLGAVQRWG